MHLGHFIDQGIQSLEEELGRTWKGIRARAQVKDTGVGEAFQFQQIDWDKASVVGTLPV